MVLGALGLENVSKHQTRTCSIILHCMNNLVFEYLTECTSPFDGVLRALLCVVFEARRVDSTDGSGACFSRPACGRVLTSCD